MPDSCEAAQIGPLAATVHKHGARTYPNSATGVGKLFWQQARDALTDPRAGLGAAFAPSELGAAASAADITLYAAQANWVGVSVALGAAQALEVSSNRS